MLEGNKIVIYVVQPDLQTLIPEGGGLGTWGSITGNIEDQEDLVAYIAEHGGKAWLQNEFEIDNANAGIILKDTANGKRYRITITNGNLMTTEIV